MGAGLSFLARKEDNQPLPNGAALVDLLLEQPVGTGSKHKLDRIAGSVLRSKGVDFIYDTIRRNFTVKSVDPKLQTLYRIPWKRIYTTNYDNAVEICRLGIFPISSITVDNAQSDAVIGSIIHLNGFVKRVGPANVNEHLLLTDTSYAANRLVDTGWLSYLERDIRTSRAVIFVGYSIYDLDIDHVLFGAESLSRKSFFFTSPDADEIEISTLSRYGMVVPGGIDSLIERITEVSTDYVPPRFVGGLTSLREITVQPGYISQSTAAEKISELLVYGAIPESEVLSGEDAFDSQGYLVLREQDKAARKALREGPWRDVLFVGEIGSGKSASTLTLAHHLREEGYRVYYASRGTSLASDLLRVAAFNDKIAVVFDGYSQFRAEIELYAAKRPLEHRIILTERAVTHEVIGEFVDRTPHLGPVREIVLDKIATEDTPGFEALTNFGGFWGDRSGSSIANRQRFISNTLDGSLYRLLVEIIKSEKVQNQIRELLRPISHNETASKIFCSALIVNSLGFEFTISEWQYLFDRNSIRSMLTNYSEQVRHFIYSDYDHIYIRTGLLSSYVLHGFMDDDLIGVCLTELYERAERSAADVSKWRSLTIELTKFSSVEPMFSGRSKPEHIFRYYDSIRVFGETRNNPDYWLQLGIASTVLDDLSRGKICFKNAYARERARPRPNLTRIDNYSARFDMQCAVSEDDPSAAFDLFIAANERLVKQIFLDINRHYPFKTGRHFADIAAKHFSKWTDDQKRKFKQATINIREKALDWKNLRNEFSPDVEILIREATILLGKMKEI